MAGSRYDTQNENKGPDGGAYQVNTDAALGVQVWTPTVLGPTGTMVPDPKRANGVFTQALPGYTGAAPKDLSGDRVIDMDGPQGAGKYDVNFGADGKPVGQVFLGKDVNGANVGQRVKVVDGNLYAINVDDKGNPTGTTALTDNEGKNVYNQGILAKGVGQFLTGSAAVIKAPAQAAQAAAAAQKGLLGDFATYEPTIWQIASDPTMTPEMKEVTIKGIVQQAMVTARTGMDAKTRAYIQHFTDDSAVSQANTRATLANSAMKDFMGGIQNLATPLSGDQAGAVYRGFMAMQQQAQHQLGGDAVPLGMGSAGVPLGVNDPHQATALAMTKAFADKYGLGMADAANLLNEGASSGFDGLKDKIPDLANMTNPLKQLADSANDTTSVTNNATTTAGKDLFGNTQHAAAPTPNPAMPSPSDPSAEVAANTYMGGH